MHRYFDSHVEYRFFVRTKINYYEVNRDFIKFKSYFKCKIYNMKKILLFAVFFVPFIYSAQMSEDFDSYADGDALSVVGAANGWVEWSGGSGTNDCTVSSTYAFSGANSGKSIGGNNGLWTWTDFTEGTIKFSMQLYVPGGSNGGYIGLGDAAMTDQPNSINVLGDSLLFALDWQAQALIGTPVDIESDSWISIEFILDFDNQTGEFIVDGISIGTGGTSFGSSFGFGGINFWGQALNPFTGTQLPGEYYFDDLLVVDPLAGIEEINPLSLNISPNPSNGNFAINFNDSFDNAAMTITNMMGSIVYSEALSSVSNSTQNFDLDLNSGVYIVKVADDANEFTTRVVIK